MDNREAPQVSVQNHKQNDAFVLPFLQHTHHNTIDFHPPVVLAKVTRSRTHRYKTRLYVKKRCTVICSRVWTFYFPYRLSWLYIKLTQANGLTSFLKISPLFLHKKQCSRNCLHIFFASNAQQNHLNMNTKSVISQTRGYRIFRCSPAPLGFLLTTL